MEQVRSFSVETTVRTDTNKSTYIRQLRVDDPDDIGEYLRELERVIRVDLGRD